MKYIEIFVDAAMVLASGALVAVILKKWFL